MNNKANYMTVYIRANEIDDISGIADKVEQILGVANGWSLQAASMADSQAVDPMRISLSLKVSAELQRRARIKNLKAPDGSSYNAAD